MLETCLPLLCFERFFLVVVASCTNTSVVLSPLSPMAAIAVGRSRHGRPLLLFDPTVISLSFVRYHVEFYVGLTTTKAALFATKNEKVQWPSSQWPMDLQ
jgi:hypothetical protein